MDGIRSHVFFKGLHWGDLLLKKIPAPFIPAVKGETDIRNFDKVFTGEEAKISPSEVLLGREGVKGGEGGDGDFEDFTYTSKSLLAELGVDESAGEGEGRDS